LANAACHCELIQSKDIAMSAKLSGTAQLKVCVQLVDLLRTRTGVFLCGVCYNLSIQDAAELIGHFSRAEILEQNLLAWTEF